MLQISLTTVNSRRSPEALLFISHLTLYNLNMASLDSALINQMPLPFVVQTEEAMDAAYPEKLRLLLQGDLDFRGKNGAYATHQFHAFPAKFPPQLPALFIEQLTQPGDVVLDPMSGSGTTLVEAALAQRVGVGCDIDPLALMIAKVKTTPLDPMVVGKTSYRVMEKARLLADSASEDLWRIKSAWTTKTRDFINYWFMPQTQLELLALSQAIEQLTDGDLNRFFRLVFSSIIITKSGGVSLARDLAHTRPHRAKVIYNASGQVLEGEKFVQNKNPRLAHISKTLSSPLKEFDRRLNKMMDGVRQLARQKNITTILIQSDAQSLPLAANSIDMIATSPPYASNAIDYMRAHKFSLVWFGYPIETLGQVRRKYVGGESVSDMQYESLPQFPTRIVQEVSQLDARKGVVLHRYYSEMKRALREMHRVLKPGKAAILVVGSSVMRGRDTETGQCLADIGESLGFTLSHIGVRYIDRDKRMMPAGAKVNLDSQIQRRMHREFVIGFLK